MRPPKNRFLDFQLRPWGLLSAMGFVAAGASVVAYLGPLWWVFDIFSHFRVQYFLALTLCAIFLGFGGRRWSALAFLICALTNAPLLLPYYAGVRPSLSSSPQAIRVLLLNVNTQSGRPLEVLRLVKEARPDLLVLQEVSDGWLRDLQEIRSLLPHVVAEPREDNFGLVLFSRFPVENGGVIVVGEAGLPSIHATVAGPLGPLNVLATHPPPPSGAENTRLRDEQLARIAERVVPNEQTILLGDLNTTPWTNAFGCLTTASGLKDSALGFGVQPSWPSFNPLLWIPIDHLLYSDGLEIVSRRMGSGAGSDHYSLFVEFKNKAPSGKHEN